MTSTANSVHEDLVDKFESKLAFLDQIQEGLHDQKSLSEQGLRGLGLWKNYTDVELLEGTRSEQELAVETSFQHTLKNFLTEIMLTNDLIDTWCQNLRNALTDLQQHLRGDLPQVLDVQLHVLEHAAMKIDLEAVSSINSRTTEKLERSLADAVHSRDAALERLASTQVDTSDSDDLS